MRKTEENITVIKLLIKKHLDAIGDSEVSRQDKSIDYLLIQEAIESLIREYDRPGDSRQKKCIKNVLIDVYKELEFFLLEQKRYDHKILDLYATLHKKIGRYV